MVTRLRVLAGPSPSNLVPITVNDDSFHEIKSSSFEGRLSVHIKGFVGEEGTESSPDSSYFANPERKGVTWSIVVQGRFLEEYSSDDILFGNTFDRPLKLPWGSSAAFRFMSFIDPTLEHDLPGQKPWALSPLVSTMPYFAHENHPEHEPLPAFPSKPVTDSVASLVPVDDTGYSSDRRSYFSDVSRRQDTKFGPSDLITTDFCYGFLSFPDISLNLPGGLSFDLMRYWDGQPVRFICCERSKDRNEHGYEGKSFWCVVIEVVEPKAQTPEVTPKRSRTPIGWLSPGRKTPNSRTPSRSPTPMSRRSGSE